MNNIFISEVCTSSLSCEPFVRRCANGELICVVQCDGPWEPHKDNRVYYFHSNDEGRNWSKRTLLYPEDGNAVYCTELTSKEGVLTAYLTLHDGRFLDWKCVVMKSYDSGYTWENAGAPPHFKEYTFVRTEKTMKNGDILIPYQYYPVTAEDVAYARTFEDPEQRRVNNTKAPYCESGVLKSIDNGKTYKRIATCKMEMPDSKSWVWSEPTIAQLGDGTIMMYLRWCGTGWIWSCYSKDNGDTWSELKKTDIPNPSCKPCLVNLDGDRIALIHTPNNTVLNRDGWPLRFPLEVWVSSDGLKTWDKRIRITDYPGYYSYSDGFYEDGKLRFVIEHNRHSVIYVELEV